MVFIQGFELKGLLEQAPRHQFMEEPEFSLNTGKMG